MISVRVNNELRECSPEQTLSVLLPHWGFESNKVAVAVNDDFVPRSQYGCFRVSSGDCIDVLVPVQGG